MATTATTATTQLCIHSSSGPLDATDAHFHCLLTHPDRYLAVTSWCGTLDELHDDLEKDGVTVEWYDRARAHLQSSPPASDLMCPDKVRVCLLRLLTSMREAEVKQFADGLPTNETLKSARDRLQTMGVDAADESRQEFLIAWSLVITAPKDDSAIHTKKHKQDVDAIHQEEQKRLKQPVFYEDTVIHIDERKPTDEHKTLCDRFLSPLPPLPIAAPDVTYVAPDVTDDEKDFGSFLGEAWEQAGALPLHQAVHLALRSPPNASTPLPTLTSLPTMKTLPAPSSSSAAPSPANTGHMVPAPSMLTLRMASVPPPSASDLTEAEQKRLESAYEAAELHSRQGAPTPGLISDAPILMRRAATIPAALHHASVAAPRGMPPVMYPPMSSASLIGISPPSSSSASRPPLAASRAYASSRASVRGSTVLSPGMMRPATVQTFYPADYEFVIRAPPGGDGHGGLRGRGGRGGHGIRGGCGGGDMAAARGGARGSGTRGRGTRGGGRGGATGPVASASSRGSKCARPSSRGQGRGSFGPAAAKRGRLSPPPVPVFRPRHGHHGPSAYPFHPSAQASSDAHAADDAQGGASYLTDPLDPAPDLAADLSSTGHQDHGGCGGPGGFGEAGGHPCGPPPQGSGLPGSFDAPLVASDSEGYDFFANVPGLPMGAIYDFAANYSSALPDGNSLSLQDLHAHDDPFPGPQHLAPDHWPPPPPAPPHVFPTISAAPTPAPPRHWPELAVLNSSGP